MCAENSHKHARAQCSLALLFTLYARNYFRVVGSSLGSTPRLATPRALDIAQLAERLTVVDVLLLDASDCYQLVTGSIPVVETRVLPPDLLQSGAHD